MKSRDATCPVYFGCRPADCKVITAQSGITALLAMMGLLNDRDQAEVQRDQARTLRDHAQAILEVTQKLDALIDVVDKLVKRNGN